MIRSIESWTGRGLALLAALLLALGGFSVPSGSEAQEALPAVLPEVLFLIEDSARIGQNWDGGDGSDARYVYIAEAIGQVIQNAPLNMTFGVALTADGTNDSAQGNESLYGFEPLAAPGTAVADILTLLDGYSTSSSGARTFAESYSNLLDNWVETPFATPRSWAGGPFQYSCSQLTVIVIGSSAGEEDANPEPGFFTGDPLSGGHTCDDSGGAEGCYADNVAYNAYNSFSAPLAGTGSVKTHAILIDSASPSVDSDAAPLFQAMADLGNGLYYSASVPGGIAPSIYAALNDSFSGSYSNAGVSALPDGSMLLGSFYEVEAGHPLYKGHLLGWTLDNDPTSTTYGRILTTGSPYGEAWDAGQLLASREAVSLEDNQGTFNPAQQRNGYTATEAMAFYSQMLPFDNSSISVGSDLTQLLIDEVPVLANEPCDPLPHDFDYDCDSDIEDAQILVDFIRGVGDTTFLNTGLPRGVWRMGDTGHSVAVAAPSNIDVIATEGHFLAYRERLAAMPGMVYVSSNAGMVHAFNLDVAGHEGTEYWFYVPRQKAHKDPTDSSVREFDGFQVDDLMRSGQTNINDGRMVLDHVWLDGYLTDLGGTTNFPSGCSGPGFVPGEADGVIHPGGCEWHRVLIWSGGFGARHVYAIDVTNPINPRFLWERNDTNGNTGPGKGRAVGSPGIASFFDRTASLPERRWLVFWGAGEQGPGIGVSSPGSTKVHASVFIHDVDTTSGQVPTAYATAGYTATGSSVHPAGAVSNLDTDAFQEYGTLPDGTLSHGLFGSPAMVDLDGDGSVDVAYIGDSLGYIMKTVFNPTNPGSSLRCVFAAPNSSDEAKHLWYKPAVFFSVAGEVLVYYGSGSPHNVYSTDQGGLYVKKDPSPFSCSPLSADPAPCAGASPLFNSDGFFQFSGTGEKLVGDPIAAFGRLFFTTHVPGSDACSLGVSRIYGLEVETCGGGIPDVTTDSYSQDADQLYTEVEGLVSEPVFANGRIYALNIDSGGMDSDSVVDDLQVVPTGVADTFFSTFRHVF